jgi:hypothetical protein
MAVSGKKSQIQKFRDAAREVKADLDALHLTLHRSSCGATTPRNATGHAASLPITDFGFEGCRGLI